MEMANKFNNKAIGAKCILIDRDKKHYLFSREEFIRRKDIYNKELVESKFNISISLVTNAVAVFEDLIKEEETENEQKEEQ